MQNPLNFYKTEKLRFETELAQIKKKLTFSSMFRLAVFIAIIFGVYFFFGNAKAMMLIFIFGIAFFLFLVSKHTDLQHKKNKIQALLKINNTEINVFNQDKSDLDLGSEYLSPTHAFSYDIDLFGNGSFFQYLNRTSILSGKDKLAEIITSNTIDNIKLKQESLAELANKPKWRQNFSATASLVNVETKADSIVNWLNNHTSFLPKFMAFLPTLFFGISMVLFGLNYIEYIGFSYTIT